MSDKIKITKQDRKLFSRLGRVGGSARTEKKRAANARNVAKRWQNHVRKSK